MSVIRLRRSWGGGETAARRSVPTGAAEGVVVAGEDEKKSLVLMVSLVSARFVLLLKAP